MFSTSIPRSSPRIQGLTGPVCSSTRSVAISHARPSSLGMLAGPNRPCSHTSLLGTRLRIWVSLERDPYAYSGVCLSRERHTPSSMALKGHARFIGATLKGCPGNNSMSIVYERVPRSESTRGIPPMGYFPRRRATRDERHMSMFIV